MKTMKMQKIGENLFIELNENNGGIVKRYSEVMTLLRYSLSTKRKSITCA